jgi:hypothetical protein
MSCVDFSGSIISGVVSWPTVLSATCHALICDVIILSSLRRHETHWDWGFSLWLIGRSVDRGNSSSARCSRPRKSQCWFLAYSRSCGSSDLMALLRVDRMSTISGLEEDDAAGEAGAACICPVGPRARRPYRVLGGGLVARWAVRLQPVLSFAQAARCQPPPCDGHGALAGNAVHRLLGRLSVLGS